LYVVQEVYVGMKTIVVNDETHAELKSWGEFGESFEDVIKKLMKCCKEKRKNE